MKKVLIWGCASCLVVASLVGAIVMANWTRISTAIGSGRRAISELQAVREEVQRSQQTPDVNVRILYRSGRKGPALVVEVQNAPILERLSGDQLKPEAEKVAIVARAAYRSREGIGDYIVVFSRRRGVGFTFSRNWSFSFSAGELPPMELPAEQTGAAPSGSVGEATA